MKLVLTITVKKGMYDEETLPNVLGVLLRGMARDAQQGKDMRRGKVLDGSREIGSIEVVNVTKDEDE